MTLIKLECIRVGFRPDGKESIFNIGLYPGLELARAIPQMSGSSDRTDRSCLPEIFANQLFLPRSMSIRPGRLASERPTPSVHEPHLRDEPNPVTLVTRGGGFVDGSLELRTAWPGGSPLHPHQLQARSMVVERADLIGQIALHNVSGFPDDAAVHRLQQIGAVGFRLQIELLVKRIEFSDVVAGGVLPGGGQDPW
jgi:hypothetical protein